MGVIPVSKTGSPNFDVIEQAKILDLMHNARVVEVLGLLEIIGLQATNV